MSSSRSKGPSISPGLFRTGTIRPPADVPEPAETTRPPDETPADPEPPRAPHAAGPATAERVAAPPPVAPSDDVPVDIPQQQRASPREPTARTPVKRAPRPARTPAPPAPTGRQHTRAQQERPTGEDQVIGRRYLRMHLYVTRETLDVVKTLQGQALVAGVPLGARGPSIIMAAALDQLLELSPREQLDAIRSRLQRAVSSPA